MWPFTSKSDSENAKLRARAEKLEAWLKGYHEGDRVMTAEVREALAEAHRNHVR